MVGMWKTDLRIELTDGESLSSSDWTDLWWHRIEPWCGHEPSYCSPPG